MKCEYFRTPSLSNKRSFYAVLRSVLWRRWYIKLSNFVYFQAATKSRRFSVTHRQLWFVQVVQLCYVSQLVARHDSQRVSLSYILLKHMIWLKVFAHLSSWCRCFKWTFEYKQTLFCFQDAVSERSRIKQERVLTETVVKIEFSILINYKYSNKVFRKLMHIFISAFVIAH